MQLTKEAMNLGDQGSAYGGGGSRGRKGEMLSLLEQAQKLTLRDSFLVSLLELELSFSEPL